MIKKCFYVAMAITGCLFARYEYDVQHVGAPPLVIPCHAGTHQTSWWVKDSSPEGRGQPGTLEYHGWREIGSCSSSFTAGT